MGDQMEVAQPTGYMDENTDSKDWGVYALETVLDMTTGNLEIVKDRLHEVWITMQNTSSEGSAQLDEAYTYVCRLYNKWKGIKEISDKQYKNRIYKLSDKIDSLRDEKASLTQKYIDIEKLYKELLNKHEQLEKRNMELLVDNNTLRNMINSQDDQSRIRQLELENEQLELRCSLLSDERVDRICKAVDYIDNYKGPVATAKSMGEVDRRGKEGSKASAFNDKVPDDLLLLDYQSGASIKNLAETYGMTGNGIRRRLVKLGVYKGKSYQSVGKYNDSDNKEV